MIWLAIYLAISAALAVYVLLREGLPLSLYDACALVGMAALWPVIVVVEWAEWRRERPKESERTP